MYKVVIVVNIVLSYLLSRSVSRSIEEGQQLLAILLPLYVCVWVMSVSVCGGRAHFFIFRGLLYFHLYYLPRDSTAFSFPMLNIAVGYR